MRLILVRHGEPDYVLDNLTALGEKQAIAAAERLAGEGIDEIWSSTCGRAMLTAEATAKRLGMAVQPIEFMRELRWGSTEERPAPCDGHPWDTADLLIREGVDLRLPDWEEHPYFRNTMLLEAIRKVRAGADVWLEALGYRREGCYYRCVRENDRTVALFSHAGSSSALVSHILSLPFPFVCHTIQPNFTGISVIDFGGKEGDRIAPILSLGTDNRHIEHLDNRPNRYKNGD